MQVFPKKGAVGPKVKLLTLWLGANDACLDPSPQRVSRPSNRITPPSDVRPVLKLPIDRCISNLRKMVSMVRSPDSEYYSPETRIILITPPPFSEAARKADLESRDPPIALDRTSENTRKYADAVIELGKELNVPVLDVYTPIWEATDNGDTKKLEAYLYDGLHLSKPGYTVCFSINLPNANIAKACLCQVVYDLLIQTIAAKYPELHYDALPMTFPGYVFFFYDLLYNPSSSLHLQLERLGLGEPSRIDQLKPSVKPHLTSLANNGQSAFCLVLRPVRRK